MSLPLKGIVKRNDDAFTEIVNLPINDIVKTRDDFGVP